MVPSGVNKTTLPAKFHGKLFKIPCVWKHMKILRFFFFYFITECYEERTCFFYSYNIHLFVWRVKSIFTATDFLIKTWEIDFKYNSFMNTVF